MDGLYKNIIIALIIFCFLLPNFIFAQTTTTGGPAGPPANLEGLKDVGSKATKSFPEVLKEMWQSVVKGLKALASWLKHIWSSYIYTFLHNLWEKIKAPFVKEFQKRKSIVQERLGKEEQEMKEEVKSKVPSPIKYIWEKLKSIF